jgi:hypothetical protein
MSPQPTPQPTWEEVLDAVAADVARAADLLFENRVDDAAYQRIIAPVALPDIADMPPVGEELRQRICDLRTQIAALQTELAAALAEGRRLHRTSLSSIRPEQPLYVDRRI